MLHETWHVSITLDDDGEAVTARAALEGAVDLVGRAEVPTSPTYACESAHALAALRSLEKLSDALEYVAGTDRLALVDQA